MPHAAKMYTIKTNGTADDRVTSTGEPSGGIPSANELKQHNACPVTLQLAANLDILLGQRSQTQT